MTWSYRIVKKDDSFAVHEVYYDDDGNPEMVTVEPVGVAGDTYKEFIDDMAHYVATLGKPVLNYEDINANPYGLIDWRKPVEGTDAN